MGVASSSAKSSAERVQPATRPLAGNQADSDIDLPALGAALWRKRRFIILPTLLAALAAYVAVQLITPK